MRYNIDVHVRVCPVCRGTLNKLEKHYKCFDCNTYFRIVNFGGNSHELQVEEIRYDRNRS